MESLKRKWKDLNVRQYQMKVQNVDWNEIYSYRDVNLAYNFLESNLRNILDQMIPIKESSTKWKTKNWITESTINRMKERDELRAIANTTDSEDD